MEKKKNLRYWIILAIMVVLAIIPIFIKTPYILGVLITTFYTACCSIAWYILGGLCGQVSLGHAGFMGLGSYISAIFLTKAGINPWISMIISFFLVGLLVAVLMSPCFILTGTYFTLVTIAFTEAFRNLFTNWEYAGGGQGILVPINNNDPLSFRWISKIPYYYIGLVMVVIYFLVLVWIDHSKLGYALKTIREDEDTAHAVGISSFKYKFIATFISAGMIAVVGVFYVNYVGYINSDIFKNGNSLDYVMPAIIGGLGNVAGPLLGSFLLTPLAEWLNSTFSFITGLDHVIYAAIAIAVILFQPSGILGIAQRRKIRKAMQQNRKKIKQA